MPPRFTPFVNGEIYHIVSRGSNKKAIFLTPRDYKRFIKGLAYYKFDGPKPSFSKLSQLELLGIAPKLTSRFVDILCFCLMPNHIHLLIRQVKGNGTSNFVRQLLNSYAKYFNTKHKHTGPLFESRFRAVPITYDEQFIHVSRYIHINPVVSHIVDKLENYPWSSYWDYRRGKSTLCSVREILDYFGSPREYSKFLKDQISYGESLEQIKHQVLEDI